MTCIKQVPLPTTIGPRRLDVLTQTGIGIESKLGYTSLTASIRIQVQKDLELLELQRVGSTQWEFSASPVTGGIGPSGPLARYLDSVGIRWTIKPGWTGPTTRHSTPGSGLCRREPISTVALGETNIVKQPTVPPSTSSSLVRLEQAIAGWSIGRHWLIEESSHPIGVGAGHPVEAPDC
jgi:hypothetical protein